MWVEYPFGNVNDPASPRPVMSYDGSFFQAAKELPCQDQFRGGNLLLVNYLITFSVEET